MNPNIKQGLIELIADFLDDHKLDMDNRVESDVHIKMAEAAFNVLSNPIVDHPKQREVYIEVDLKEELPEVDTPTIFLREDGCPVWHYVDKEGFDNPVGEYGALTHWLKKATTPIVEGYSREDMYMLSAHVVNAIAANLGNLDFTLKTTPKIIAAEFLSSLPQHQ